MIRLCIISPKSHLEYTLYGDNICMVLSHMVLQDDQYADYFFGLSEKGWDIILDNSAFELEQQGKGLDPKPVIDAARRVRPHIVIATDVLNKGQETIESTKNFIKDFQLAYKRDSQAPVVMGVVQGSDEEEWFECFAEMVCIKELEWIGLSKVSIPTAFLGDRKSSGAVTRSRIECAKILDTMDRRGKKFHLLGGDNWSPYEVSQLSRYNWIESNDTSAPVWYGANNLRFDITTGRCDKMLFDKPDLENKDRMTKGLLDQNTTSILHNLLTYHLYSK